MATGLTEAIAKGTSVRLGLPPLAGAEPPHDPID